MYFFKDFNVIRCSACMWVHLVYALSPLRPEVELWRVVCLNEVLGTKPRSSARAARAFNEWTLFSPYDVCDGWQDDLSSISWIHKVCFTYTFISDLYTDVYRWVHWHTSVMHTTHVHTHTHTHSHTMYTQHTHTHNAIIKGMLYVKKIKWIAN